MTLTTLGACIVTGALTALGGYVLGVQTEREARRQRDLRAARLGATADYPVPEPVEGYGPLISEKRGPPPEPVEMDGRDTWGRA